MWPDGCRRSDHVLRREVHTENSRADTISHRDDNFGATAQQKPLPHSPIRTAGWTAPTRPHLLEHGDQLRGTFNPRFNETGNGRNMRYKRFRIYLICSACTEEHGRGRRPSVESDELPGT